MRWRTDPRSHHRHLPRLLRSDFDALDLQRLHRFARDRLVPDATRIGSKHADDTGVRPGKRGLYSRKSVGAPGADALDKISQSLPTRGPGLLPRTHPRLESGVLLELRPGAPLPLTER